MSAPEDALAFQLKAVGIDFISEYQFAKPRKWRADFIILHPGPKEPCYLCDRTGEQRLCKWHGPALLIEVDGGSWVAGRHTTGAGFARDCEKLNQATELGYRILRFTPSMVEDGSALAQIERCLQ